MENIETKTLPTSDSEVGLLAKLACRLVKVSKKDSWAFTMGLLLALFAKTSFMMWEFYVIVIPIIILVEWKAS